MVNKILIIEDDLYTCMLLKRQLKSNQYQVEDAHNLKEGYEKYKSFNPDLLLLDVNLPDGNGAENAYRFRELNRDGLIIIMSGDNSQIENDYVRFDANGFLQKPFKGSQVLVAIDKLISVK